MSEQRHIVQFKEDGWILMHPFYCRNNLFECPVNGKINDVPDIHLYEKGRYWVEGVVHPEIKDRLSEEDDNRLAERVASESAAFQLARVLDYMVSQKTGGLAIGYAADTSKGPLWTIGFEFGQEADDSPMVGGSAYAAKPTMEQAIGRIIEECGLDARGF